LLLLTKRPVGSVLHQNACDGSVKWWFHALASSSGQSCNLRAAWRGLALFERGPFCNQEYQKKTLNPVWKEDKWLLVQEPKTQAMRVQMFDHDILNIKVPNAQKPPSEYRQWIEVVAWSLL
jgi:hypothetical protein